MLCTLAIDVTGWMRKPMVSCSHDGGLDSNLAFYVEAFGRFDLKRELSQGWGVLNLIPTKGLKLKALMPGETTQALSTTSRRDSQIRSAVGSAGAVAQKDQKSLINI